MKTLSSQSVPIPIASHLHLFSSPMIESRLIFHILSLPARAGDPLPYAPLAIYDTL
jgi:hypothetical protein